MVVLRGLVDFLVCSENRGSRSSRFDDHLERGNNLCNLNAHHKESDQPCAPCTPQPFLFVKLIIDTKLRLICLLASIVLNWLVTYLFDSFGRLNRLCELKHLA